MSEISEKEIAAAANEILALRDTALSSYDISRAALEAAARVRAEAAAETLIDTVSEEVWNHDASQDNCNVIDKDGLTNAGEPVAYRWRYRNSITNTWSNWIDGKGPEKPNPDDEIEEQALYTHPAPQPSGTVKPLDEDDYEEIISAAAINMRKATSGIRGQVVTVQDSIDWWVMKETERRILSALSAAARVRAEDNAETLIDVVSEEVWNHDASQDNCNVIDKDGLATDAEHPTLKQWREDQLNRVRDGSFLSAYPAPQPSGTVEVKPLADLIHDALTFAVWAAGEGLCPTNGPTAPEDFLYAYSTATGFEDWDAIPHHVATILSALTAGKPEQAAPSGKHWFAVQSPTGVHIGLWDDGKIAYGVAAEYGSDYTIMELVELPVAPTAGGGDA